MGLSPAVEKFRRALEKAEGVSEFVIVVVCDVRGFSDFSTRHESPDTAMYIKRLYLQLITHYFPTAKFVKPTGDGLLLLFPYDENNLREVAETVLNACFSCVTEFAGICKEDPMINFEPPKRVGIGVSRGPACCLLSGKDILDYSGHLLNLASRLMDLARPSGILVDGSFMKEIIPDSLASKFSEASVYVRSLAEDTPRPVFLSKEHVQLSASALSPISTPNWRIEKRQISRKMLAQMPGHYGMNLRDYTPKTEVEVTITFPNPKLKGYTVTTRYLDFEIGKIGNSFQFETSTTTLANWLKTQKLKVAETVELEARYIAP